MRVQRQNICGAMAVLLLPLWAVSLAWGAQGAAAQGEEDPCAEVETGWYTPREISLGPPVTSLSIFERLASRFSAERFFGAAERSAQKWFRLDEVDLGGEGVHLTKRYGSRVMLLTSAGLGSPAETSARAEYRLLRDWFLRSETRERGDTSIELRHEIVFW